MLEIAIPGSETLRLDYLVADFNGTLACDGLLLSGVAEALGRLRKILAIHVVTADTFGRVREAFADVDCKVAILPPGGQDLAKRRYVEDLGAGRCCCLGNGRNDRLMLKAAGLSIAVMQGEGQPSRASWRRAWRHQTSRLPSGYCSIRHEWSRP